MGQYIARRLLLLIPVLFGVSLIVFFLIRLVPGDTAEAMQAGSGMVSREQLAEMRRQLGLDKPAPEQYATWLARVVRGDLGDSLYTRQPVAAQLLRTLPVTLELAILALLVAVAVALPLGILSAVRQDTAVDYFARFFSVGGLSVPDFVLGSLFLILPVLWFRWQPPLGYTSFADNPAANLQQFALPALALGLRLSATTLRMVRSSMLEVLRADYIRTARAKGLRDRAVVLRHALRNAMIAPITLIGHQVGFLLGGAVIMETIFALPGVGRLTFTSIQFRDYPQIQGNVLFLATVFVLVNLVIDLSYGWFDPRIRFART